MSQVLDQIKAELAANTDALASMHASFDRLAEEVKQLIMNGDSEGALELINEIQDQKQSILDAVQANTELADAADAVNG